MKLENEFRVDVPVEEAWRVLLDVERIAPCMPGAQLQEVEGDEYRGIVKVKVGPITAQYKGVARITESDDANHRAVIRAEGRDTRGQGNASATATAVLQPDGDGTRVNIDSDVTITGKVAQFGRGVIADVSAKLLDQFVACLESDVLSSAGDRPTSSEIAESGKARTIEAPEAEPVDLLRTAGAPVLKRVVPVAAAAVVVIAVVLILLLR
jgi:carbon monoxide dehydrogenase subunit G